MISNLHSIRKYCNTRSRLVRKFFNNQCKGTTQFDQLIYKSEQNEELKVYKVLLFGIYDGGASFGSIDKLVALTL